MKKLLLCAVLTLGMLLIVPAGAADAAESTAPYTVSYFTDAELTAPVEDITKIPSDEAVYYKVDVAEGYRVYRISVTADFADSEKIIFGNVTEKKFEASFAPVGDFDCDGDIDLIDATNVLKKIAGHDIYVGKYLASLDFNGDGRINNIDCAQILKHVARWEGVEPACGVMEDVPVYCEKILPVEKDAIVQNFGQKAGYQMLLTVARSEDDLEKYFADVAREHFNTDDPDSGYTESELTSKYGAEFFAGYDLAIIDAENVWWLPKEIMSIHTEITDGSLTVVMNTSPGALNWAKGDVAHYLVPIPKGFDRVEVISRNTTDFRWNDLIKYEETSLLSTDERPFDKNTGSPWQ